MCHVPRCGNTMWVRWQASCDVPWHRDLTARCQPGSICPGGVPCTIAKRAANWVRSSQGLDHAHECTHTRIHAPTYVCGAESKWREPLPCTYIARLFISFIAARSGEDLAKYMVQPSQLGCMASSLWRLKLVVPSSLSREGKNRRVPWSWRGARRVRLSLAQTPCSNGMPRRAERMTVR